MKKVIAIIISIIEVVSNSKQVAAELNNNIAR